jgi:hypothetical protein
MSSSAQFVPCRRATAVHRGTFIHPVGECWCIKLLKATRTPADVLDAMERGKDPGDQSYGLSQTLGCPGLHSGSGALRTRSWKGAARLLGR